MIPSTLGITELSRLRNIPMEVKSFSLGIASFDVERMKNCLDFLNQVLEGRIIPDVTPSEVVEIVGQRDFTISEKAQFLFWISTSPTGSVPFSLFSHIRVPCGTGNLEKLSNVKFCPPDTECDEIPLPEVCLGLEMYLLIPKNIWINFFGLKQLPLVRVAQYAAQKIDGTNVAMAERLLRYIYNKTLGNMVNLDLTEQEVAMVISSLANHSILPVMVSNKDRVVKLLKPNECYLPDVKSFGDVPTATISGVTDEFLISLGVQSHMEVRTIISNLKTLNWSHSKLIKYLATVEDQLSNEEIQSLREARIFPAIDRVNELFCIAELYGPADDSAVNMCGFPVLEWKKGGESVPMRSDAAFFLSRLGMLTYIPLSTLITLISTDSQKRPALLRYLVERFESVYQNQYKAESIKIPFLPISSNYRQDSKSELELALPSDCYTDEGLGLLGFRVLHPQLSSYARMFGVSQRPNADELVHAIIERRFEREKSADLFGYLSSILSTFRASHLNMMSRAEIIYISGNWRAPSTVFFRPGRIALKNFHIIDFGSQSKPFLNACGVQEEPRATQVADRLCTEGQMILDTIGSVAYTDLLRWIALQHDQIKHESPYLFKKMATSICLIGHQFVETCVEIPSATVTSTTFHTALEDEQEVSRIVHTLAKAEDIYVVDDSISMQIFNCTACPNDQLLENFYGRLGCKLLSSTVKQTWEVISTGVKDEQKSNHEVSKLESLIKSRSPLIASEIASTLSSQSKCNETSMLKNLLNVKVSASQSIFVIRSLGRRENRQKTSAATIQDGIINVTVPFNSFDVAVALSKVMTGISGTKMAEALLISTLLMTPLPSLRSMGFAVDRVLAKTTAKSSILTPEDSVLVSNHSNSSNEIKTTAKQNDQVVSGKLADRLSGQGKEMEKYQESIERDDVNNSFLDSSMSSGNRNSFSTSDLSGRNKKIGSETIDTGGGGGGGGGEKGGSGSVFSMTKAWVGKVGERIAKAVNMGPRTPIFDAPGLQGALQNSIRSLKNYGGKPIDNANASINEPGSISQTKVDEESCKIMPGESLIRIGQVRSFTMYATSHEANKIEVGGEILNSFADILETLCTIFKADAGTINIFCNRESRTIAFNRGLTLFFNIAFYERQINRISRKEMLCNWYMTFCHELAHNFVGPHDLQHEFYMSAFAESYLPKLASFL